MNERKVTILAVCTALLVPAPRALAAQLVSTLQAGSYTVSDGVLPESMLRLAPDFHFDLPHASITARGSAFISEQQVQVADGIVSGTFTSPTVYGVRAEMIGNASRAVDDRSLGTDQVDVQTRIHVLFHQRGGMWFGGGVARPWRVAVVSSADIAAAGIWTTLAGATVTATFTNFSFTKTAAGDTVAAASVSCAAPSDGACERQSHFGDLEGVLHWEGGPLELDAQTGYRFGNAYDVTPDSRRWSSATATIWLNDRIAVVGGGGRQPALPLRGLPARSFGMAGLELAYSPSSRSAVPVSFPRTVLVKSFELHAAPQGMEKIVIRVGGVETVDVMGDFSDWSPLTLVRRGRDLWELSMPLSPGMHQITVRTDGGPWMAPPGMPTMHDSYGGDVGLLVIDNRSNQ